MKIQNTIIQVCRLLLPGLSLLVSLAGAQENEPDVKFRFPISNEDRHLISSIPVMGMDHDPATHGGKANCRNFRGSKWPFCYNDHRGTDYVLIGGFATMDNGSASIVAAADGKVTQVIDGHYDRCAVDVLTGDVSCFGNPMKANIVTIAHKNGTKTRYVHFKKNSIAVRVGQSVRCGQHLGLVGSSGHSSMPHLHFEVIDQKGKRRDPYAGKYSQNFSYWKNPFDRDGLPSGSCRARPNPLARCKWEAVQSAALCGTETVENAMVCGTEIIGCGTELVSCGTEIVTDAAKCGTKLVTSAAQCGFDLITDVLECARRGFAGLASCQVPRSCRVAKTCEITKKCEVEKECTVAKSCQVPKSCLVNTCSRQQIRDFPELRTR